MAGEVVLLAGGTGGAKLARGMLDVAGEDLAVIANTADDVEIYGALVSPDPDLCTFWLADRIHDRGFGLRDDTFTVMDGLGELGVDPWFALGDRDLAIGLARVARQAAGIRPTEFMHELADSMGVRACVLPMCDEPVRTQVKAHGKWMGFQEFMIRRRGEGPVEDVALAGIEYAKPTPEVLDVIAGARAIIIGPSNPTISIGPILAVPGLRDALIHSLAPVVAVSPIVGGDVLKGPTDEFMRWAGLSLDAGGIEDCYADIIDGLVADEPSRAVPGLQTDTLMGDAQARRRLASEALSFAEALG